jgi:glutamate-ammonia-ligase adenylyltransferase
MHVALTMLRARIALGPDPVGAGTLVERFVEAAGGAARADELLRSSGSGRRGLTPAEAAHDQEPTPHVDAIELAATLFEQSPWLSQPLIREPERLLRLADDPTLGHEKGDDEFRGSALRAVATVEPGNEAAVARALRRWYTTELLRLAARELSAPHGGRNEAPDHATSEAVARELSRLAASAFDAALADLQPALAAAAGLPSPVDDEGRPITFTVLGLGKLGGVELNFSSDVDVLYVYRTDRGHAGRWTVHEYFRRLSERLTRTLGTATDDGALFRIDLRLRPEGSRGPLCNSLPSLETYYETWGRPFERQALLKARGVAGDLRLGDEVLERLSPFVHPRTSSPAVLADVLDLGQRIRAELDGGTPPGTIGYDVKVGAGGIREIEFFVQALQLLHGGKHPVLRTQGTLPTLDRLHRYGWISGSECHKLKSAYRLFRLVEHRIQLDGGQQSHRLPVWLSTLARRLGYPTAESLSTELAAHAAGVSRIYSTLRTSLQASSSELVGHHRADSELAAHAVWLLDPSNGVEVVTTRLALLGVARAADGAYEIEQLRGRSQSPFGPMATTELRRLGVVLLTEILEASDPDRALGHLAALALRWGPMAGMWRLLIARPNLARMLVRVLEASDYLAALLLRDPEQLEPLAQGPFTEPYWSEQAQRAALERWLTPAAGGAPARDVERILRALGRFRNEQLLRIGILDLNGRLPWTEVCTQLSAVADRIIAETARAVRAQLEHKLGPALDSQLAVIALGKLGGHELGYASDVDLMFVYDEGPVDRAPSGEARMAPQERWSRFAQRLIAALSANVQEGRLYEVDTRLRPSGRQGTLVTSLDALRAYHQTSAAVWERLALVRARVLTGDAALTERVRAALTDITYGAPPSAPVDRGELSSTLQDLRRRIDGQLVTASAETYNIKLGRGGLVDVEMLTQALQLVHGANAPALRVGTTWSALRELHRHGALGRDDFGTLRDTYAFLRELELQLRVVDNRGVEELDATADAVGPLAWRLAQRQRLAPPSAAAATDWLHRRVRDHAAAVRQVVQRHLEQLQTQAPPAATLRP